MVGKKIPVIGAEGKGSGAALYGGDIRRPGMLTGRIVCSPLPHARIKRISTSRAERLPGVRAVVTGKDLPRVLIGSWVKDRTVFALEKVRHVGEPIAAVAAMDEETAEEAVKLIDVEYEELPAVTDPRTGMEKGTPLVHPELAGYEPLSPGRLSWGNVLHQIDTVKGDISAALRETDAIIEGEYSTQFQHQAFIQPHQAVAEIDPGGLISIWSSTKFPFSVRNMVAGALALPLSRVRIITAVVGGDFGGKSTAIIEPMCALLALKTGTPVKMAMNWDEEFTASFVRSRMFYRIRTGVKKDGRVISLQADIIVDIGAYCGIRIPQIDRTAASYGPYNIPNLKISTYNVYTNNIPTGYCRAPRVAQLTFAVESHMDVVSHQLGIEPLELRRVNCHRDGDILHNGLELRNVSIADTVERTEEYLNRHPEPPKKWRGWGVACAEYCLWPLSDLMSRESAAQVKLNEDGTAVLITGAAESGGGQLTVLAQIVSQVLDLPLDHISIVAADTASCPYEMGTVGSRTTYQVGNTVKQAAEDARRKVLKFAASLFLVDEQELKMRGGLVFLASDPKKMVSVATIAARALGSATGPIIGASARNREESAETTRFERDTVDAPDYATHAALVEVDPETGRIKVLRYIATHDIGFAINPMLAETQVEGGVVFGLGYALSEDTRPENGRNLARNFTDYKLPTAVDIPPMEIIFANHPSTCGPFGAKGIGEPPTIPVAAAIANAVFAAAGVRVTSLPITSEKVLQCLQRKGTDLISKI
ncbi:MAG: xanthine dehydrogenase family protein molybdopterin-binding subunit [Chloroflexi bacterium]|nr:xanthine dehydrogenase family protein molybdopterin-binding subunit [Chloroflexota bacterium]MBI4329987.1 xanthine dehydrogenase family protein molybdopterin-binding subunit [Chloroflexota bacterium]